MTDTKEIQSGSDTEDTPSESNPEETAGKNHLHSICSTTSNKKNPFATWRPFIHQPVYQNSSAQPWLSVSSSLECSSQEPTLTAISTITCSTANKTTKPTQLPVRTIQTNHQMKWIYQHTSKLYRPKSKNYKHNWNKHRPGLNSLPKRTKISHKKFLNHQGQFKPSKLFKQRLPFLTRTDQNQNTKWQITPPEIDAGSTHQPNTLYPSRTYSSMMFRGQTTETRF